MYTSQGDAVKEWLEGYRREESELADLIDRVRELRSGAEGVRAQELSFMPKAHNGADLLTEYVIRLEMLEGNLEKRMRAHERDRAALVDLVNKIRRTEERNVIKCRYLYGMEWGEIRPKIYSREKGYLKNQDTYERRMFRAHNRAIEWMGRFWDIK